MSLLLYKFGALFNALVWLVLVGVFVTLQVAPELIVNLLEGWGVPEVQEHLGDAIINTESVETTIQPLLPMLIATVMFIVGSVVPFVKIKNAVKSDKEIKSFGFFLTGLFSITLGGGIIMMLATVFGLRKKLEEKRKVRLFDSNQMNVAALPANGGGDNSQRVNNEVSVENHPNDAPSYDRHEQSPYREDRRYDDRRSGDIEDDLYFARRRDRAKIAELEDELYNARQRSRR